MHVLKQMRLDLIRDEIKCVEKEIEYISGRADLRITEPNIRRHILDIIKSMQILIESLNDEQTKISNGA